MAAEPLSTPDAGAPTAGASTAGAPRVAALYVYPVKSLAGVAVPSFDVGDFGPAGDRRWMLVDDDGTTVAANVALIYLSFRLAGRPAATR
jgi:uncharacterized protein YcbX